MLGNKKDTSISSRRSSAEYKKQPIYSYRSSRKQSQRQFNRGDDDKGQGTKYSNFVLSFTKIAVALIVIAGIAYFQSLNTSAKLKVVGESGFRETSVYSDAINKELKSSKLNLSKFTFNSNNIKTSLQAQYPEIEDVKIDIPIFQHQPKLEISLARPVALLVTSEKTYFIDTSGRALFTESDVSDSFDKSGLITVNDTSGHSITLGKPALTSAQINFIRELKGQSEAKSLKIDSLTLSSGGSGLNVKFNQEPYIVKFSFMSDPRQSSGAFLAIREQIKRDNIKVSEYVDVRIPERAYVK